MKSFNLNMVERLADVLVDKLQYSDGETVYPETEDILPNDGLVAEWFYPVLNGSASTSELSAIIQYVGQEGKFEEIGELMLGIALVEMKHYGKLSDVVARLGGKVITNYNSEAVKTGNTAMEALEIAIKNERDTIVEYNKLAKRIEAVRQTSSTITALQLIAKIIADEEWHINLLEERLKNLKNERIEED